MKNIQEEVKKAWDAYDHYKDGMKIIDTDYDKWMLMYHCREEFPDVYDDDEYRHDKALEFHDNLSNSQAFDNFKEALKKTFDEEAISEEEFEQEL